MTEALTESAALGVGVDLVVDRVQTFSANNVYSCPRWGPSWILGEPTRDDLGSCSGTLARPILPFLPFHAVIPLYLCVSLICTAYTLTLSCCHVVTGEPRAH